MYCKTSEASRLKRILQRWGFYGLHFTAKWDEDTFGDPMDPEAGDQSAVAEWVLVVNGEPKNIGLAWNSIPAGVRGESKLLALLGHLGIASGNLGGPPEVMKARAALQTAIEKSLE